MSQGEQGPTGRGGSGEETAVLVTVSFRSARVGRPAVGRNVGISEPRLPRVKIARKPRLVRTFREEHAVTRLQRPILPPGAGLGNTRPCLLSPWLLQILSTRRLLLLPQEAAPFLPQGITSPERRAFPHRALLAWTPGL